MSFFSFHNIVNNINAIINNIYNSFAINQAVYLYDNKIISHGMIRCNRNITATTLGSAESNEIRVISYWLLRVKYN